jgi:hypothetical protein
VLRFDVYVLLCLVLAREVILKDIKEYEKVKKTCFNLLSTCRPTE